MRIAKLNEEAGFDSLWIPDHILFLPPGIVPEAWSTLAAVAVVTTKVILGTCVTGPHRYHPAVLAQKVATACMQRIPQMGKRFRNILAVSTISNPTDCQRWIALLTRGTDLSRQSSDTLPYAALFPLDPSSRTQFDLGRTHSQS